MKNNKFKSVVFNNHKKQLTFVYTSGKKICLHYGCLGITSTIQKAWIDPETRQQSIGFEFENGKTDYMPYDQPLALAKDPDYLLENQIETLVAMINQAIKDKKISKRYLAQRLHTSDNQVQRLLNPKILNKNLTQLYQIASLLGLGLEITLKAA